MMRVDPSSFRDAVAERRRPAVRITGDHAVAVLALAVVALLAVTAAPVARRLAGGEAAQGEAIVAPRPLPPLDLAPLRRFAPFGTRAAAAGDPGEPSTAGLQLRGILLARPAAASIALIAAAGGPAKGYSVGAVVPGGAVLDAVEFDLVVLRANGQLVTLGLPTGSGASRTGAPAAAAAAAGPATAAADPIAAHLAQPASQRSLTLLGTLGATAGPGGYRVGVTVPDELRRAGLAPGDTIEKVDGVAVGNAERDRTLFDDAVVAGRMRVDVIRAGRPVTLTIPLH